MSAQLRFRTLIKHAGGIYDAVKEARTDLLVGSLDDIVEKINPQDRGDWIKVEFDTRRLLKVWLSREQTHAAQILADQIMDSLMEFAATNANPSVAVGRDLQGPLPHLEIIEKPAVAPATVPVATLLTHSIDADSLGDDGEDEEEDEEEDEVEDEDDEEEAEDEEPPAPAVVVTKVEEKKPLTPEPEADDNSSAPPAADHDEEGEVAEDDDGDSAAESNNEEVLEPEPDAADADAEEEEGMEVEKRTIRGRDYWLDVNTNKLYAVIDDDDVGDEVGAIVGSRPVFMAA